jgi:hypothetical protein
MTAAQAASSITTPNRACFTSTFVSPSVSVIVLRKGIRSPSTER